jgi:predicted ArsR family transcriptional regulator
VETVNWADEHAETVRVVAALDDPTRRALYSAVRGAGQALTREQAAAAAGVSRKLAAFHLDKLVEAGLLVVDEEREAAQRAGRPPKRYRRSARHIRFAIPDRRPELLAEMLVEAVATARPGETPRDAVMRVGRDAGRRVGAQLREERRPGRLGVDRALSFAHDALRARGFEPARESGNVVRLVNCPFQPFAEDATELVCGMNEQFATGLIEGLEIGRSVQARLRPVPGMCCVELRAPTSG